MIDQRLLLENPFPGLRPFDSDEADRFFGRDGQSDEVLAKLRRARFVAVVGTSGSGKSSLVRAGVLPALYSGHLTSAGSHWRVAIFRPGKDPIGNLADALSQADVLGGRFANQTQARNQLEATLRSNSLGLVQAVGDAGMAPHENLLLVADQFEELFRFRSNSQAERPEDEAAAFVKLLLEARASGLAGKLPVYLILTMRSDYLGEAARFRGLPEAINEGQYLIPRMNDEEWREAITGPVWMNGAKITPQLVNRLLNDAGDRALLQSAGEHSDRLPILQHALMRTWEYWRAHRRGDEAIDLPHYGRVGGMARALSLHADEAFFELSERRQVIAEELFRRLTEKGPDGREGRRPATVREICATACANSDAEVEDVRAVIESFRREGRSFLMPPPTTPLTPDTLIDISHESLIWGWDRLRQWVDKEADCSRILMRLSETAKLHAAGQEGYLRNPALQVALDWREKHAPNAAWAVRYCSNFEQALAFLESSRQSFAREEQEREEQRQRELRQAQALAEERQRRLRLQRIGLLILSALLLGMAGLTAYAFQQKAEAEKQRGIAETERNDARKQRDRATSAEVQAREEKAKAEIERDRALKAQADAEIQRKRTQQALASEELAKKDADQQRQIAVERQRVAEARQKEAEAAKKNAEDSLSLVNEIDYSARFLISIWREHDGSISLASFLASGKKVFASDQHGDVKLLEIKDAAETFRKNITPYPKSVLVVSPDGKSYLESSNSGRFFGPVTKHQIGGAPEEPSNSPALDFMGPRLNRLALSSNGNWVAAAHSFGVEVWNARTSEKKFTVVHKGNVNDVAFSPDGTALVTASDDGTAQVWSVEGKQLLQLRVGIVPVRRVGYSHQGAFLAMGSADGTAQVWDARTGEKLFDLIGHKAEINSIGFSPDDRLIVTASSDRTARIWRFEDARQRKRLAGENAPRQMLAPAPKEKLFFLHVLDAIRNMIEEARAQGSEAELAKKIEISSDAAGEETLNLRIAGKDLTPGEVESTVLTGHEGEVNHAIFSADGKWVITASEDRTARIWQAVNDGPHAAGNSLTVLRGHIGPVTSLDFNGPSKYLVTGSADRTVRVWDVSTLGGLAVSARIKAEPSKFEENCPVTIRLTGTVKVDGSGGTVRYQFVSSEGELGKPQELFFDSPGEKEINESWTLNRAIPSGWVAIRILDPQPFESERIPVSIRCQNYEKASATQSALLTEDVLRQIMPRLPQDKLTLYLPFLQRAMAEFEINTPARQAMFLAQIASETGELRFMEEIWGPTANQLRYEPPGTLATQLGNTEPGDGKRFKGRGPFGMAGRKRYAEYGQAIGEDLVNNPDLAATPQVAFRVAAAIWQRNRLNESADKQDLIANTKQLTSGTNNGLAERQRYYSIAKQVLGVSDLYEQKQAK